jgi:hypothetical protein
VRAQVAQRDQRLAVGNDEVDHAKADECLEQADPDGSRVLQVRRHHPLDVRARTDGGEEREREASYKDGC